MPATSDSSKARLFLSYSRRDTAFVDELIISIESHGFEILLDRQDLFPGEQWEPRLHRFISEADTTVCVVSSNWVASEQCTKELSIALDQGRRIIPVVIDQVHPEQMPEQLARLQFVFFHGEGRSYARGVASLVDALRTDIDWVREQSRLLDKAQEWASNDKSKALVLRGAALEHAMTWIGGKRPEHTRVLPVVADFVAASHAAQDDDEKSRLRGRVMFFAVAGLALAGALTTGLLFVETQRRAAQAEASEQERLALAEQLRARELDEELTKAVFELSQADDDEQFGEEPYAPAPTRSESGASSGAGVGVGSSSGSGAGAGPPSPGAPVTQPSAPAEAMDDAPATSPPPPPAPAPGAAAGPVARLNSVDKATRVQAGQDVVDAIRSGNNTTVLRDLIGELEPARYNQLSGSGRFNVLYMLNVESDWAGSANAASLTAALDRLEAGGVGGQSQDCINNLRAKLRGDKGASDRCGGK